MENNKVNGESKCPFSNGMLKRSAGGGTTNRDWGLNQLKLNILRQNSSMSNPMEPKFNYAEAFKSLDLAAVKKDIYEIMTSSQEWRQIMAIMGRFLSAWHGIVPVHIASTTGEVVPVRVHLDLHHSTAGRTIPIWIKQDYCSGRSKRNMAIRSPGPTS